MMVSQQGYRVRSKWVHALSAASLAVFAMAQPGKAAVNLLSDPGFESGTPNTTGVGGWEVGSYGSATETASFSTAKNHTSGGTYSLETPSFAGDSSYPEGDQEVSGSAGQTYTLSGYVLTPTTTTSTDTAIAELAFLDSSGNTLDGDPVFLAANTLSANTWTSFTASGVAPSGTVYLGVVLLNENSDTVNNADFYFDDISLTNTTPVPEPTSAALGVSAIGGLLLKRRRA